MAVRGADVSRKSTSNLSVHEFSELLRRKNVSDHVIENAKKNLINGELFLEMKEDDLVEIAPLLADRLILRRLIRDCEESNRKFLTPRKVSSC